MEGNRYAIQVAMCYTIGSLFVIVDPINNVFHNSFWIAVSAVMVCDNTIGGLMNLSVQRFIGTVLGGILTMVAMTITKLIFKNWTVASDVVLGMLMFAVVFIIGKIRHRPTGAQAGNVALLTMAVISLTGHRDLINDKIWVSARLSFWRIANVILGIVISISLTGIFVAPDRITTVLVLPVRATHSLRHNLGSAMEEAAELFEQTAAMYLDLNATGRIKVYTTEIHQRVNTVMLRPSPMESVVSVVSCNLAKRSPCEPHASDIGDAYDACDASAPPIPQGDPQDTSIRISFASDASRASSERVSKRDSANLKPSTSTPAEQPLRSAADPISELCNRALRVLNKLQAQDARLKSVSNEYYLQLPVQLCRGQRERGKQVKLQSERYYLAIDALKRIVWPLVSYRLLLPLLGEQEPGKWDHSTYERFMPTRSTLENFDDSLQVMRRLSAILKDHRHHLSEHPDWLDLERKVQKGHSHIQQELKQLIALGVEGHAMDGVKAISYYGFLVRTSMIWDGLVTIVQQLGPGWHSRRPSLA
ncbi:hypothetical protein BC940DRAFT_351254 [Gongronella butleri]|nr:hypothetical protein BC940DRAFT_351254 [Gongronella butleri]